MCPDAWSVPRANQVPRRDGFKQHRLRFSIGAHLATAQYMARGRGGLRRRDMPCLLVSGVALAALLTSCLGTIDSPGTATGTGAGGPGRGPASPTRTEVIPGEQVPSSDPAWDQAASPALRRLSRREFEAAIADVFDLSDLAQEFLPGDVIEPFDTDADSKDPSRVFVDGLESLATRVAETASANASWVAGVGGCMPGNAADRTCLETFVRRLGRRLWRRPLTDVEITRLVDPGLAFASERNDVVLAVRYVVQAILLHPEFSYRVELGEPTGELRRLSNFELVSRLAYLLWGRGPDPALLDRAAGAALTSVDLVSLAEAMLGDPRTAAHWLTFHEQWLAYRNSVVDGGLRDTFMSETDALLRRTLVTEQGPWSELFTSRTTFVDSSLAEHYGMPQVTDPTWVTYENDQRAGILSHGSILSLAVRNGNDTSPVSRGHFVSSRLLCRVVPPPPANVDVDNPPVPDADTCKFEAYAAHRELGSSCYACHVYMDPIGFGLERFDGLGQYRETEPQDARCEITGDGELAGNGTFNGPRELAELMVLGGDLQRCVAEQFLRFSAGRPPQTEDSPLVDRATERFVGADEDFRALVLALVSDPTFLYRREEAP